MLTSDGVCIILKNCNAAALSIGQCTANLTYQYVNPPDGHEGDLVFISWRLGSASGRLFDGILNASFQAFFSKIRKEF